MTPISEEDVLRATFASAPLKGPGIDRLPSLVWKKTWSATKHLIVSIFQSSMAQGFVPDDWKIAKITSPKKPGKADYTNPKSYRPISLLLTLSKAMEAVVAERISYLVEEHGLLPSNHFGGLKQRSTVDVLVVLQEKIYQAWRDKKVLSLITFDVKGAFNGVATPVLLERLREKRVPEDLVRRIQSFCSDRKATVIVNGESTPILSLAYAGLPQGSPLSPILYLFFNATLIQSVINKNRGAIAFVDDYSAWVTGPSIKENEERLQERIIPHVQKWANESGSVFQAKKTIMTHSTRHKKKLEEESTTPGVFMNGTTIKSSKNIKILGVILDQGLRYIEHVARARDKGIKAALALKRLRNLKPETSRQLYKATVAAATDYASVIWSPGATLKTLSMLDQVQRIGSQAIIGAFRTTALAVSEVEASLLPTLEVTFTKDCRKTPTH